MTNDVRLIIVPEEKLPYGVIFAYWLAQIEADLLKYRLADIESPDITDVKEMRHDPMTQGYYVIDTQSPDKPVIITEFMLNNFMAKSAQIHFSMNPDISPQLKMRSARETTDSILNDWVTDDNEPFLHSIYGLTPTSNRAACAFVQRVGFKKVGILPGGCYSAGRRVADAMMTIKTRVH